LTVGSGRIVRTADNVRYFKGVHFMRHVLFMSAFITAGTCLFAAPEASDSTGQKNQQNQNEKNDRDRANRGDRDDRATASSGSNHWKNLDHCFATCVAYGNQEEVALAHIAKQRAKTNEVKQFAEMMIHDHQEFLAKLQKFAPEASKSGALGATASGELNREGNRSNVSQTTANDRGNESSKVQTAENRNATANASNREGREATLSDIERELAEQCISSARRKLESKSGEEFDKCYINEQIAKHTAMKNKLTVYERHASGDLAATLADGLKTTEHHLMKAEEIAKSLEGSTGAQSRRESSK
jgi:predicted outer membrane protein